MAGFEQMLRPAPRTAVTSSRLPSCCAWLRVWESSGRPRCGKHQVGISAWCRVPLSICRAASGPQPLDPQSTALSASSCTPPTQTNAYTHPESNLGRHGHGQAAAAPYAAAAPGKELQKEAEHKLTIGKRESVPTHSPLDFVRGSALDGASASLSLPTGAYFIMDRVANGAPTGSAAEGGTRLAHCSRGWESSRTGLTVRQVGCCSFQSQLFAMSAKPLPLPGSHLQESLLTPGASAGSTPSPSAARTSRRCGSLRCVRWGRMVRGDGPPLHCKRPDITPCHATSNRESTGQTEKARAASCLTTAATFAHAGV